MNERVIESERITVKLLNGSTISIRPLTLSERKECLSFLPKTFDNKPDTFVEQYLQAQIDIVHFIVARENKKFKKEDVGTLLDTSLIEKIINFTLKDPFKGILGGE